MNDYEKVEEKNNKMIGETMTFSGGLFSGKKDLKPKDYEIFDWRWGSAKIMNMKTMEAIHPTVEFLIKNEEMKRKQWTRPFPVREIKLEKEEAL